MPAFQTQAGAHLARQLLSAADAGRLSPQEVTSATQQLATRALERAVDNGMPADQARSTYVKALADLNKVRSLAEDKAERARTHVFAPTTGKDLAKDVAVMSGLGYGFQQIVHMLRGRGGLAPLGSAMHETWTSPSALKFMGALEVGRAGLSPLWDPQWQRGERGYLSSVGNTATEMERKFRQANRKAFDNMGALAVPATAVHGLLNPLTSAGSFVRSVGQLGGAALGLGGKKEAMDKSSTRFLRMAEIAADMVRSTGIQGSGELARRIEALLQLKSNPEAPKQAEEEPRTRPRVPLTNRLRGWLMGINPEALTYLQSDLEKYRKLRNVIEPTLKQIGSFKAFDSLGG